MTEKNATIDDVALAAGVSVPRVQRFYERPGSLPRRIRVQINDAVLNLGYEHEGSSLDTVLRKLHRIAVVSPYITAYSFMERIRGVGAALPHDRYEVVAYSVESSNQLEHYMRTLVRPGLVDGIILMSLPLADNLRSGLQRSGIPLVSVERTFSGYPGVSTDNTEGGRLAARYLLKKGYRKPAFLGDTGMPIYAFSAAELRFNGFRETLTEAGIELPERRIGWHKQGGDSVPDTFLRLMGETNPPDALFCASDLEAIIAIRTAGEMGLNIPGDIAILGFDNIELADYSGLSTIDQYLEKSGHDAAQLLTGILDDGNKKPGNIEYELEIRERRTT